MRQSIENMCNRLVVSGAAGLLVACADSASAPRLEPGPVSLTVVSGSGQTGFTGQELPQPLVVKVVGAKGRGVSGQLVNFRVTSGGGQMYAGSSLTDANGQAEDYWTLGPTKGTQQVDVVAVDPTTGSKQTFGTFTAIGQLPATLTVSPTSKGYGSITLGNTSAAQSFTVANVGDQTTGLLSGSLSGTNPGDYTITANNCAGISLAAAATCTVSIAFHPQAEGARSATFGVSAAPGGNVGITLSGTGQAPLFADDFSGAFPGTGWTTFNQPGISVGVVSGALQISTTAGQSGFALAGTSAMFPASSVAMSVDVTIDNITSGSASVAAVSGQTAVARIDLASSAAGPQAFFYVGENEVGPALSLSAGAHSYSLIMSGTTVTFQVNGVTQATSSINVSGSVVLTLVGQWITAPNAPSAIRFDNVVVGSP